MSYKLIDFDNFPMIYGKITIPKNTIFYRGFDPKYPAISNRPAYFTSNYKYAEAYHSNVGTFITTDDIILYDIRYIKNILNNLFVNKKLDSKLVLESSYNLALSFGLCTFNKQIEFYMKRYYNNIDNEILKSIMKKKYETDKDSFIEQQGYRFAETNNEVDSILFLKELFRESIYQVDGFVAPYLYSPFHIEKEYQYLNPEIVLFNPEKSNIKLKKIDKSKISIDSIKITSLLNHFNEIQFDLNGYQKIINWIQSGGSNQSNKNSDANTIFDRGDKYVYQKINQAEKTINTLLNGNQNLYHYRYMPKVSPWLLETNQIDESDEKIPLQFGPGY